MSHVLMVYSPADSHFARQLAVHIDQRGFVVWPVPDTLQPSTTPSSNAENPLTDTSHVLCILSSDAAALEGPLGICQSAAKQAKHAIIIRRDDSPVPDYARACPSIDFSEPFLVAMEELIDLLTRLGAPTHPLTVDHPPPVVKSGLLPNALPSERCWREDRVRINYVMPIILPPEELALRLPAFLVKTGFELTDSSPSHMTAQRARHYGLFDPRRAEHTLTIAPEAGDLLAFYKMARTQVYHWFPAHYHVLDREAAALYRYLATGKLDNGLLEPVRRQAERARVVSWGTLALVLFVVILLAYLIAR